MSSSHPTAFFLIEKIPFLHVFKKKKKKVLNPAVKNKAKTKKKQNGVLDVFTEER